MDVSETRNEFEDRARARKAAALAALFHRLHVDVEAAMALDSEGRLMACRAAGINTASDRTWTMAMDLLGGLIRADEALDLAELQGVLDAIA